MKNGRPTRSKKKMTVSLAVIAGFVPIGADLYTQIKVGDYKQASMVAVHNLTGFNQWTGKWDTAGLKTGLLPIVAGIGVHKLAGWLGINRALAASGIPFVRI